MDQADQGQPLILLRPMSQWADIRDDGDDWTGITNTAQRRKLQNRLNQRARRRRKMQSTVSSSNENGSGVPCSETSPSPDALIKKHSESSKGRCVPPIKPFCLLGRKEKQALVRQFAERAYADYLGGTHCLSNLPTILTVNAFYALSRNAAALGVSTEWLTYDAISPFCREGPGLGRFAVEATATFPNGRPESLHPTELQVAVPHHPWIDLFPIPRLRDNLLSAISTQDPLDEDELCFDMLEISDGEATEKAALIVWGDPWDPKGWEVSVPFLRKWGSLLQGCYEMLEATNYWREKRGERRIFFAV
ncbi:hypothetical protein B0T10DRAFT_489750 [Thelonectria olida]|uniref:Uncharacterized protein n=1 Tax=Thelonectria olida TaxID=1576542 RepID=A0A9P9AKG9_9HYPO|nr:hypothetical protein B0T10DRAFT_489750 [Thelonectria olida]